MGFPIKIYHNFGLFLLDEQNLKYRKQMSEFIRLIIFRIELFVFQLVRKGKWLIRRL